MVLFGGTPTFLLVFIKNQWTKNYFSSIVLCFGLLMLATKIFRLTMVFGVV
jgi:hypothetical protein